MGHASLAALYLSLGSMFLLDRLSQRLLVPPPRERISAVRSGESRHGCTVFSNDIIIDITALSSTVALTKTLYPDSLNKLSQLEKESHGSGFLKGPN